MIIPNIKNKFKQNQKVPFFSLFSASTAVWITDGDMLVEKLQLCFEKADQFAQSLEARATEELREIFEDRAFVYPAEVVEQINKLHQVILVATSLMQGKYTVIDCKGKPQPNFNKNFTLLLEKPS